MLRVRLVDGLRLEVDGREIAAPRSRRARSLLAWLAVHPGMHARSELAGRFWPDVLDQSARASLRAALTELRAALGDGAAQLISGREIVGLAGDALWIDVREFERLIAAGELEEAIELGSGRLLARIDETPFVGREREMERLCAAWADVTMHSARRLVLIAGEPGIGKTHLMLRFGRERQSDAGAVLLGRCSEEPLSAYEPFAEVLRHCSEALGPGFLAERAGQGGRELDRLLGQAQAEPEGDAGARHRLFEAVDAALCGITGGRPLLLLLDDLHWADHPTMLLLSALLHSARRVPLLVVATWRDRDAGRGERAPAAALADLHRERAVQRVAVPGLAPRDVAALARSWLDDDTAERVAGAVHARSGGNAFFVEELLRGLSDREIDEVPHSVRQAVAVRVGRLGEDAAALLAVAAVLGLEADLGILEAVSGLEPDGAEAALDELLGAYLLRPSAGAAQSVEFPHALVREAVDAECNPLRRRRLHKRAADVLASISEERHLEAIAHHLDQAAVPARPAASPPTSSARVPGASGCSPTRRPPASMRGPSTRWRLRGRRTSRGSAGCRSRAATRCYGQAIRAGRVNASRPRPRSRARSAMRSRWRARRSDGQVSAWRSSISTPSASRCSRRRWMPWAARTTCCARSCSRAWR